MKFKKLLSVILAVIIVFGMLFVVNAETEIPDGYTPIYTAEDLNDIRNNLDGKYILMNDIDLSAYENWEPIGTLSEPFTGEFDGNGKSVLNLTIKDYQVIENKIYIGMFSSLNSCSVMNLNLVNVDIDIRNTNADSLSVRVGALAGYASKCFIENCAVTGNITVNNFSTGYIGGLLGSELSSMPSECANYADISVSSDYFNNIGVGGIAGCALMITECCNYGDITVSSKDTDDADSDVYIGGICGKPHQFGNTIRDCYNRGPISLDFTTPSTYVGGIIGQCVNLEKCYNSGKISHPHIIEIFSGAIAGEILTMLSTGGRVSYIDTAYYTNSNVSCVFRPDEYDDIKNVKQLEIQEFRKQESFVGFDFENIWEMEENGYPVLKNQPEVPDYRVPIYTAEDLNDIRNNLDGKYILMNDIDLSVYENWEPIGTAEEPFTGEFDGNGYSIKNLSLKSETEEANNLGLFGFVNSASIGNVNIRNAAVNVYFPYASTYFIGCVAAYCSDSKIYSCYADGTINVVAGGNIYTGGIVGYIRDNNSNTEITDCISDVKIDIVGKDEGFFKPAVLQYTYVGGIAGFADLNVTIRGCTNKGDISVDSINVGKLGGIIGYSETVDISECGNTGLLNAEGTCEIIETDKEPEPNPVVPEPVNNVESAEIVYVPLKNRIVFSAGSPNHPDGIVLKLTYKDGTEKTETVIYNAAEGCYRAGEERVIGSVRTEVEEYGLLTDTLYINDNTVSVKYDYFVPPTLSYIFMEIVNFVLSIVVNFVLSIVL